MPVPIVRADYDQLTALAARYGQQAELTRRMLNQLRREQATLQDGDWLGGGAQQFYAEMNGQVMPTLTRLVRALEAANTTTLQIAKVMQAAEQEAASYLRTNGRAAPAGPAGAGAPIRGSAAAGPRLTLSLRKMRASSSLLSKVDGFFSSAARHAGDFVVGAGKELFSIGKGVVLTVAAPAYTAYQTVKGLWHVANNPRAAWEALKKPYVEAWKNGRPFEAIGRGYIFVGSLFVGGGEVKAGLEARKAAEVAGKVGRAAETAALNEASQAGRVAKMADAAESAGAAGKGGKASQVDDLLAKEQKDLAEMAKAGQTEALPKTNPMANPTGPVQEISADLARAQSEVAAVKDVAADIVRREQGGLDHIPSNSVQGHGEVQRVLEDEVIASLQEAARSSPEVLQDINRARANNGLKPVQEALEEAEAIRDKLSESRTRLGEAAAEDLQIRGNPVPWW